MSHQTHKGHVTGTHWDPNQYLRFRDYRLRPALELLHRVPIEAPEVVYDLGCGSGNVTRIISERWASATVYGVDSSKEMLEKAASGQTSIHWFEADIRDWRPERPPDLIYSNATLQWVENHGEVFKRLVGFLKSGGCLAVQMPLSWYAPSHRLMRETLADGGPKGRALGSEELREAMGRKWVDDADVYYDILAGSASTMDIWETEYLHILEGDDAVFEWVKGTALRPVLSGLEPGEREIFVTEYRRRLRTAYPMRPDGRTLFPFRRLFIVATI